MPQSTFVYVVYIRTTPDELWKTLVDSERHPIWWFGARVESAWKTGAPWKMTFSDGRMADSGEVLAFEPPRRLQLRWRNEWSPELKEEGYSVCTMELEPIERAVKLTVTHEIDRKESRFIGAVSQGWPRILSNLKSLLETGAPVDTTKIAGPKAV